MKIRLLSLLCVIGLLCTTVACGNTVVDDPSEPLPEKPFAFSDTVVFPDTNTEFSLPLAKALLPIATAIYAEDAQRAMTEDGFTVIRQVHYDKPREDAGHTCAYTLGEKTVSNGRQERRILLVALRGTMGGEWYSNVDVAPSHADDTQYAENFLACAQDVREGLTDQWDDRPIVVVCGYSRGAAAANLLGVLLEPEVDDLYVYTFATPTTVRGEAAEVPHPSIFNIINESDLVPRVPLESWGFRRAGTDICVDTRSSVKDTENRVLDTLNALVPTISSYYEKKHSLLGIGKGVTLYEMACRFCDPMTGIGMSTDGITPSGGSLWLYLLLGQLFNREGGIWSEVITQHAFTTYESLLNGLSAE